MPVYIQLFGQGQRAGCLVEDPHTPAAEGVDHIAAVRTAVEGEIDHTAVEAGIVRQGAAVVPVIKIVSLSRDKMSVTKMRTRSCDGHIHRAVVHKVAAHTTAAAEEHTTVDRLAETEVGLVDSRSSHW